MAKEPKKPFHRKLTCQVPGCGFVSDIRGYKNHLSKHIRKGELPASYALPANFPNVGVVGPGDALQEAFERGVIAGMRLAREGLREKELPAA